MNDAEIPDSYARPLAEVHNRDGLVFTLWKNKNETLMNVFCVGMVLRYRKRFWGWHDIEMDRAPDRELRPILRWGYRRLLVAYWWEIFRVRILGRAP